ncbi:hypothetical protein E2C01_082516 [Portunus trituberculatus]|uniref:Uncharacterized protein n=1 Tax=Portunus trituberculatus TaxID=210409 RepID=A0A5B7IYP4_PORTR|nr:hypothetical protein [Portunus trituberculatus]
MGLYDCPYVLRAPRRLVRIGPRVIGQKVRASSIDAAFPLPCQGLAGNCRRGEDDGCWVEDGNGMPGGGGGQHVVMCTRDTRGANIGRAVQVQRDGQYDISGGLFSFFFFNAEKRLA